MNDYEEATLLDWVEYEFATIEYDYRLHPEAAERIRNFFQRLYKAKENNNGTS